MVNDLILREPGGMFQSRRFSRRAWTLDERLLSTPYSVFNSSGIQVEQSRCLHSSSPVNFKPTLTKYILLHKMNYELGLHLLSVYGSVPDPLPTLLCGVELASSAHQRLPISLINYDQRLNVRSSPLPCNRSEISIRLSYVNILEIPIHDQAKTRPSLSDNSPAKSTIAGLEMGESNDLGIGGRI